MIPFQPLAPIENRGDASLTRAMTLDNTPISLGAYGAYLQTLPEHEVRPHWQSLLYQFNRTNNDLSNWAIALSDLADTVPVISKWYSGKGVLIQDEDFVKVKAHAKAIRSNRQKMKQAQDRLCTRTKFNDYEPWCSQEFMDYVIVPLTGGSERAMDAFRDAEKAGISPLNIIRAASAWLVVRRSGALVPSGMRHPFSAAVYITPGDIRAALHDTRNGAFFPPEATIASPQFQHFIRAHNLHDNDGVLLAGGALPFDWYRLTYAEGRRIGNLFLTPEQYADNWFRVRNEGATRHYLWTEIDRNMFDQGDRSQRAYEQLDTEDSAMPSIEGDDDQDSTQGSSAHGGPASSRAASSRRSQTSQPPGRLGARDVSVISGTTARPSKTPSADPVGPRRSSRTRDKDQPSYGNTTTGSGKDPHTQPISTKRKAGEPPARKTRTAKQTSFDERMRQSSALFEKLHISVNQPTNPKGRQYNASDMEFDSYKTNPTPLQSNLLDLLKSKINGVCNGNYIPITEQQRQGILDTDFAQLLDALEDLCMLQRPSRISLPSSGTQGGTRDNVIGRVWLEGVRDMAEIAYAIHNDRSDTMREIRDIVNVYRDLAPNDRQTLLIGNGNEFANGAQFLPSDVESLLFDTTHDGWLTDSALQAAMAAILNNLPVADRPNVRIMPGWDFLHQIDNPTAVGQAYSTLTDHLPAPGEEGATPDIYIPLNIGAHHILIAIIPDRHEYYIVNSLGDPDVSALWGRRIDSWICSEWARRFGYTDSRRPWIQQTLNSSQQTNGRDCGVFVIHNFRSMIRRRPRAVPTALLMPNQTVRAEVAQEIHQAVRSSQQAYWNTAVAGWTAAPQPNWPGDQQDGIGTLDQRLNRTRAHRLPTPGPSDWNGNESLRRFARNFKREEGSSERKGDDGGKR